MYLMNTKTKEKFDAAKREVDSKRVLVAFSGGLDSTVLASLVKEVASKTVLLTVSTQTVPQVELDDARRISKELGLDLVVKDINWLANEDLSNNSTDRCFRCKEILADLWLNTAEELGLDIVVEGTTASEVEGYRPGLKALEDSGVISPLLDAGLSKEELREYARERGLSVAEKASMACLATRFPYGTKINQNLLTMVEKVENAVIEIFGVKCVRARYHGNLVRIEVGANELERMFVLDKLRQLDEIAKGAGFTYVTLDLTGYRTGAMDERLNL